MTRFFELILLVALLTLLAAPTLSVRRLVTPPPLTDAEVDETARDTDEGGPSEDGSQAETSPLEILAYRPELPQSLLRFVRTLELAKPLHRPAQQRATLVGPEKLFSLRLEDHVIRSRCPATSIAVVAPPHRPHAPPALRPIA